MSSAARLGDHASDLVNAARDFQIAAEQPGTEKDAPAALASLEEALQALSASWYQVAADLAPSRERVARLIALHDVAIALDRCARACRDARSTVAPLKAGCDSGFPHFERRARPTGRAA